MRHERKPTLRLQVRVWIARLAGGVLCALAVSSPADVRADLPAGVRLVKKVSGLREPVSFAFAADGRLFIAERTTGQIRLVRENRLLDRPLATVSVSASGERGLLGIALHPSFESKPYVYVLHSRAPDVQRITRFTVDGDEGTHETVIFDGIPAASIHNGGGLGFGPDGKLYFSVGDNGHPSDARHPSRIPGKIHRINPDGTIPDDNPWPGQSAFCLGCRNVFDFDFRPGEIPVVVYASENGPSAHDEINRVQAGQNLGWPDVTGRETPVEGLTPPLIAWTPTTAPVGIVHYHGQDLPPEYFGDLFFAEFNTGSIRRVDLDPYGVEVLGTSVFLDGDEHYGPLFGLAVAPDGSLWFSTATDLYRIDGGASGRRQFIRGNVDGTNGVDIRDAAALLRYLLVDGAPPACRNAADVNDDELTNLSDVSTLLGFLFGLIPDLPDPFPLCGNDAAGSLPCHRNPPCD